MRRSLGWATLGILANLAWGPQFAAAQILPDFIKPKVDTEDLKLAEGKRKDDADLRCLDGGTFIGGIDRAWSLLISGPPRRRFYYSFDMMGLASTKVEGTYEVKDGLALFTGTIRKQAGADKQKPKALPVRFGLNFAFIGDKVQFNVLRADGGNYLYRRQGFARVGDQWQLREEQQLTFVPKKRTDKEITFEVKGQRTLREGKDAPKKTEVKETLTYALADNYWKATNPPQAKWLPQVLRPQWADADKKGLPICFHVSPVGFGQVRGFTFGEPPN